MKKNERAERFRIAAIHLARALAYYDEAMRGRELSQKKRNALNAISLLTVENVDTDDIKEAEWVLMHIPSGLDCSNMANAIHHALDEIRAMKG